MFICTHIGRYLRTSNEFCKAVGFGGCSCGPPKNPLRLPSFARHAMQKDDRRRMGQLYRALCRFAALSSQNCGKNCTRFFQEPLGKKYILFGLNDNIIGAQKLKKKIATQQPRKDGIVMTLRRHVRHGRRNSWAGSKHCRDFGAPSCNTTAG